LSQKLNRVRSNLDVKNASILAAVLPHACLRELLHPAGLSVVPVIQKASDLFGRADFLDGHTEKLLTRIAILLNSCFVDCNKS